MNPTKIQKVYLNKYFKKLLSCENQCSQCSKQGNITNAGDNLIEFNCQICNITWTFESKETFNDMLFKGMGVKEI